MGGLLGIIPEWAFCRVPATHATECCQWLLGDIMELFDIWGQTRHGGGQRKCHPQVLDPHPPGAALVWPQLCSLLYSPPFSQARGPLLLGCVGVGP